jgi:hypothetical protein
MKYFLIAIFLQIALTCKVKQEKKVESHPQIYKDYTHELLITLSDSLIKGYLLEEVSTPWDPCLLKKEEKYYSFFSKNDSLEELIKLEMYNHEIWWPNLKTNIPIIESKKRRMSIEEFDSLRNNGIKGFVKISSPLFLKNYKIAILQIDFYNRRYPTKGGIFVFINTAKGFVLNFYENKTLAKNRYD